MSMKIFTLSAVCVLVYGLMIALSGTTSFPGYSEERDVPGPAEGHQQVAVMIDGSIHGPGAPSIQDLNRYGAEAEEMDRQEGSETQSKNRPIRLFGVMFILVWIYVSVKLLSTD